MKILAYAAHAVRVVHSLIREAQKARSSEWPKVEQAWRLTHPTCAACGTSNILQVHHKRPFHLDPKLELDLTNLITLCMSTYECHLRIGHGDHWSAYNPNVVADAAVTLATPDSRSAVEAEAKANRLFADPIA